MRDETTPLPPGDSTEKASWQGQDGQNRTATLRVLATTDLHMQLLGFDYVTDRPLPHPGLAGLATLITEARAEAAEVSSATLLLDNGDFLQGSALGDDLARREVNENHPLAASLHHLGYDAVGLGNHDLDYGQDYLRAFAKHLKIPLVSTNLALREPGPLRPLALLDCPLPGGGALKAGIISVLPEETAIWNGHRLGPDDLVLPLFESVTKAVEILQQKDADLIILLAHLGIEGTLGPDALALSSLPGIDLLIAGHTHRRFPGQDHSRQKNVDPEKGLLSNRPAMMPGYGGSDLGVMDIELEKQPKGRWRMVRHRTDLRTNGPMGQADPLIKKLCQKAHQRVRKDLSQPVGRNWVPIHNYFSLAMPTPASALLARAQARVIRRALGASPEAQLPLLAAAPAHTAGGRGGPEHYLHIPEGPLLRRHLSGLAPYADQIWAIRINGRNLKSWLERSALAFNQLFPKVPEQGLVNPGVPAFDFDTIYGLDYAIDPTRPPGHRITELHYEGAPLHPEKDFLLVTNQFRAAGGGGHRTGPSFEVIHKSDVPLEKALIESFQNPWDGAFKTDKPWRFACPPGIQAVLETAPAALWYLQDAAHLSPLVQGRTDSGFARLRLTL